MSSPAASNQSQVITNIIFGIAATFTSIITVWQGHRAWRLWHELCYRQQTTSPDIELGLTPSVLPTTGHEEPGDGHSQSHLTGETTTPKPLDPDSAISSSLKDVTPLEAIPHLDLLATQSWEQVNPLSETFPSSFRRSTASSRSEVELRMPPKPSLLRNSKSLEAVPHFSLY